MYISAGILENFCCRLLQTKFQPEKLKNNECYWPSDEMFVIPVPIQFQPIKLEQPRASALGWTLLGLAWAAGLAGSVAWCKQW